MDHVEGTCLLLQGINSNQTKLLPSHMPRPTFDFSQSCSGQFCLSSHCQGPTFAFQHSTQGLLLCSRIVPSLNTNMALKYKVLSFREAIAKKCLNRVLQSVHMKPRHSREVDEEYFLQIMIDLPASVCTGLASHDL